MKDFQFDNKRHRVKYCPCKKSNKDGKFVPYKGFEKYGFCHSCSQTFLPKKETYKYYKPHSKISAEIDVIDTGIFAESHCNYDLNNFVIFLKKKLHTSNAMELVRNFYLGTSKKYSGHVIYWQIDEKFQIRTGKIMSYNPETGKRNQSDYPKWVHKELGNNMKQCLFGLHLINKYPDKDIHIVESEKTAVLMSYFNPSVMWLASGGSNGLQSYKFEALKGRNVCLFPDQGKYELWNTKMNQLQIEHPSIKFSPTSIECDSWFKNNEIEKGDDIADCFLKSHRIIKHDKDWEQGEYDQIFKMEKPPN